MAKPKPTSIIEEHASDDEVRVELQAFLDVTIYLDAGIRHANVDTKASAVRSAILQAIRAEDFSLTGWTTEP